MAKFVAIIQNSHGHGGVVLDIDAPGNLPRIELALNSPDPQTVTRNTMWLIRNDDSVVFKMADMDDLDGERAAWIAINPDHVVTVTAAEIEV
jgi:hypothetical protein